MENTQSVAIQTEASKILQVGDNIVDVYGEFAGKYILKADGGVYKCMEKNYESGVCYTWLKQPYLTHTEVMQSSSLADKAIHADFVSFTFWFFGIIVGLVILAFIFSDEKGE